MSLQIAAQYRRRARSLRTLAGSLEALPLMQLESMAGAGTWRGPRPRDLTDRLRVYQHRLHGDAETLRSRAWWLEREAAELERAAAIPGVA